jgi:hypothetical protein
MATYFSKPAMAHLTQIFQLMSWEVHMRIFCEQQQTLIRDASQLEKGLLSLKIFQTSRSNLKILGARKVTFIKSYTDGPKILGATEQNSVT